MAIHGSRHFIICLFTSHGYGRYAASPEMVLNATWAALLDMQRGVREINRAADPYQQIQALHACRFNSGLFGVEWGETRQLIDRQGIEMVVYAIPQAAPPRPCRRAARRGARRPRGRGRGRGHG